MTDKRPTVTKVLMHNAFTIGSDHPKVTAKIQINQDKERYKVVKSKTETSDFLESCSE